MTESKDIPLTFKRRNVACEDAKNTIMPMLCILCAAGYINDEDFDIVMDILKTDRKLPPLLSIWRQKAIE